MDKGVGFGVWILEFGEYFWNRGFFGERDEGRRE